MITFARSRAKSSGDANAIGMAERLRRLCSEDPMLLALTIGIVALISMFCLFAMADVAILFGADTLGNFLRDAGQQVGGAGGLGAAGAGAAGASDAGVPSGPWHSGRNAEEVGDASWPDTPQEAHTVEELRDAQRWERESRPPDWGIERKLLQFSEQSQKWAEWVTGMSDVKGTAPGGSKA